MKAKVLIAGGGIALTAIIPFATLNNFSNSIPVQAAPQYADLSSPQGSVSAGDSNPLGDSSEDLGSGASSSRTEDLFSRAHRAIFTSFQEPPKRSEQKSVLFNLSSCKEETEEPEKENSFTCSSDQEKLSNHENFLDHYLKMSNLSTDIAREQGEPEYYVSPSS